MDARSQVTSEKKVLYLLTNDVVKYRNYHFLHKITCGKQIKQTDLIWATTKSNIKMKLIIIQHINNNMNQTLLTTQKNSYSGNWLLTQF